MRCIFGCSPGTNCTQAVSFGSAGTLFKSSYTDEQGDCVASLKDVEASTSTTVTTTLIPSGFIPVEDSQGLNCKST
eukprot:scaffold312_cov409-Pavlova_lutheri.AAC.8